jgi:CBS domain-containing membrane protein
LGGLCGTLAAGALGTALLGSSSPALPWLVAPIGASAVLVFAVPASPLAQPWPLIGGDLLSAALGLLMGHAFGVALGMPWLGAGVAVGLAIAAMSVARCLHPPGGACALLYALGAAGPERWGAAHLMTTLVNVSALAAAGWLYNNVTGHRWPHRPVAVRVIVPGTRSAQVHEALTAVLADWDEVIDADIQDLDAIFQAVERRIRSSEQDSPPTSVI